MALQFQTASFTITNSGEQGGQPVTFSGTTINTADVAIKSVDVSYDDGSDDHNRGTSQLVPSVSFSGITATVDLDFNYSDDDNTLMTGLVTVLVIADVD